jgi:hypothetical protein
MRSIPFNKLPKGFIEVSNTDNYLFFKSEMDHRIFWKRKDKNFFMYNRNLNKIPLEEKVMFWYDSYYLEITQS